MKDMGCLRAMPQANGHHVGPTGVLPELSSVFTASYQCVGRYQHSKQECRQVQIFLERFRCRLGRWRSSSHSYLTLLMPLVYNMFRVCRSSFKSIVIVIKLRDQDEFRRRPAINARPALPPRRSVRVPPAIHTAYWRDKASHLRLPGVSISVVFGTAEL